MKKVLALLLIALLSFALVLASCDNEESSSTESFSQSESESLTESETETQKPENAVTVKFDTQGGTQIDDAFVEIGKKVSKPSDPEKAGYTFDGWYIDDEKWSFAGHEATEDMTLVAKWTPVSYTITFANSQNSSISYTIEDSFDLPNEKVDDYYEFLGWFEDEDLTSSFTKIEEGTYGDKTLYASTKYVALKFTLKDGEYSVSDCDGKTANITIPSTYQGKSVTSIGERAFEDCTSLTSIVIPDSVTTIGYRAFSGCTSLTVITIPDSVTSIESYAFFYCTSLTSVNISDLKSWCNISFENFDANPLSYTGNSYPGNLCLNGKLVTNLVIPNTVSEIKNFAFYKCTSLTSITIPNSVTEIRDGAFSGCTNIKEATIPTVAISYIPQDSLQTVVINGGNAIEYSAFKNCTSLTSATISDSVTSIGISAFSGCSSLTSLTIGDSVTSIGECAFYNCTSLTSVTIGNGVTRIGSAAFEGCSSLTSVTIGDSVTSIGSYAFQGCTSLTSITIPDSVTSIGHHAFTNCTSLTSITIPNSVTTIGSYAFRYCTSLKIYAQAQSQPSGWDSDWNESSCPVVWGHTHSYTSGECVCGKSEN